MRITGVIKRGRMGGGQAAAIASAFSWALGGYDTSTILATADSEGIGGSAVNGISVVVAWTVSAIPATLQTIASRNNTTVFQGWRLILNGAALQPRIGNGAAELIPPQYTVVAGDVGKLHVSAFSTNLATIVQYMDRVQVGASTAWSGVYTPSTRPTSLGSTHTGGSPGTDLHILGVAGRDSALSLADYQTICDATKAAGVLTLGGISMEHQWNASQSADVPSTIADSLGGDTLTFRAGVPTNLTSTRLARVWGF